VNNPIGQFTNTLGQAGQAYYQGVVKPSLPILKSITVDFVRKALCEYYPNVSRFEIKISGRQNFLPPLACDTMHHHLDSDLVCVYYLKVPKKSGDLLLLDPRGSVLWDDPNICTAQAGKSDIDIACEQGKVTSKLFRPFHRIRPLEGNMVLHPGYLNHQVETNLSGEDRISIVMFIKIDYMFGVS
jgi:hypothetical protein